MNDSVFIRIFSYRERCNICPLENFIIEILAFCLEYDIIFRHDFFNTIFPKQISDDNFKIKTQSEYEGYGRPDIEVTFDNTIVLFECKVESKERENQLSNYTKLLVNLKSNFLYKHVFFLTKYFEYKEQSENQVELHLIRWFSICNIIGDQHLDITREFKKFLKENNMEKVKNFNLHDLIAMKSITESMTKMDELLEQFKPEFAKQFGGYSKDSSRSTGLSEGIYTNYSTLNYDKKEYWISIGFFWWQWDPKTDLPDVPEVGISIEIPFKKFEHSELIKILNKELLNTTDWKYVLDTSNYYYYSTIPLTDFITMRDDNIPAIKKVLQERLNYLYELREKYPQLLKKEGSL